MGTRLPFLPSFAPVKLWVYGAFLPIVMFSLMVASVRSTQMRCSSLHISRMACA